jgi:hypothetical protein
MAYMGGHFSTPSSFSTNSIISFRSSIPASNSVTASVPRSCGSGSSSAASSESSLHAVTSNLSPRSLISEMWNFRNLPVSPVSVRCSGHSGPCHRPFQTRRSVARWPAPGNSSASGLVILRGHAGPGSRQYMRAPLWEWHWRITTPAPIRMAGIATRKKLTMASCGRIAIMASQNARD